MAPHPNPRRGPQPPPPPANFFGCEETSAKLTGGVRYIQEDVDLECTGTAQGRCASRPNMNFGAKGF